MNVVRKFIAIVSAFVRGLSFKGKVIAATVLGFLLLGGVYLVKNSGSSTPAETVRLRAVSVVKVTDLQNDTTPLPLVGEVQSVNEASIRTQSSGPITHLYRRLGEYVSAGTIIAEIDNASERAVLLQAQGALDSAKVGVQKSDKIFGQSKGSTVNIIKSVYSSNDDLIRSKLDVMFLNPTSVIPRFVLSVYDQGLQNKVLSERQQVGQILIAQSTRAGALNESSDLTAELAKATEETRMVKTYIDDLAALLHTSLSSTAYPQSAIDGFIAIAGGARTAVSASLSGLSAAAQALISANTSADSPQEVSSSEAALKTAQGIYDGALASLEKTIIRAPISGTLNGMSLMLGDFVSTFQQVAVVANNGTLEIVAHITPQDRTSVVVGAQVKIENEFDGVVRFVAPAIDPLSKKIEVKIGLSVSARSLNNGESVHLDIVRPTKVITKTSGIITLPVAAVKITADGPAVFTVDDSHHLVVHEVKTGNLVGDKIQILSGVTSDMMLVSDARGLKDGLEVEVQ